MADKKKREEYVYEIENIRFIVTPVYKEPGESLLEILMKLMLSDMGQA